MWTYCFQGTKRFGQNWHQPGHQEGAFMQAKVLEVGQLKSETQQPLYQARGGGEATRPLTVSAGNEVIYPASHRVLAKA